MYKALFIFTILIISQVNSQLVDLEQYKRQIENTPPSSTPSSNSNSDEKSDPITDPNSVTPSGSASSADSSGSSDSSSASSSSDSSDAPPTSSAGDDNSSKSDSRPQYAEQSTPQLIRLRDVYQKGQTFLEFCNRLTPKVAIDQSIPPNNRRRLLVQEAVQAHIDSFPVPDFPDFEPSQQIGAETGPFNKQICNFDAYTYTSVTNEFLHVDSSYNNIFPGSVLQSKYLKGVLDGSESQVPVPAGSNLKNPNISFFDQANVNAVNQIYSFSNISRAISRSIGLAAPQNKDYTIYFEMGTTDDLTVFSERISFNKALLRKLGIQTPSSSFRKYQKKMIFLFTKPIATFNAIIKSYKPDLPNTPLNTFFSPNLNLSVFKQYSSWWGPTNPPVYIDSVAYGSMLILTVDFTKKTAQLYKKFEQQTLNGQNGPAAAQKILNAITSQPSLKVFSRGPFNSVEFNSIKNGNWLDKFLIVPNDIINMVIQPMVYSVKDFNQIKYKVLNQYNFVQVCATPVVPPTYKFFIKFQYILNEAPVVLIIRTLSGHVVVKLYFYCAMIFDITPYLNDPQMVVIIRPTVSCSCATRRQQVKAGFIVNNVYTHKLQLSCLGNSCVQYDAGTYSVFRDTGIVSP